MTGASNPPLSNWLGEGGQVVAAVAGVGVVATEATDRVSPHPSRIAASITRDARERESSGIRMR